MQKGFKEVNLHGCVSGVIAMPEIGENGNWFIGNDDTGVQARGSASGADGTHYSTDEQVIGTWIDGSILYRKVIDMGTLPNNNSKLVAHGIENLSRIIRQYGSVIQANGYIMPLPYQAATLANSIVLDCPNDNTTVRIVTLANRSSDTAYVTLEYTKTL